MIHEKNFLADLRLIEDVYELYAAVFTCTSLPAIRCKSYARCRQIDYIDTRKYDNRSTFQIRSACKCHQVIYISDVESHMIALYTRFAYIWIRITHITMEYDIIGPFESRNFRSLLVVIMIDNIPDSVISKEQLSRSQYKLRKADESCVLI